jgi:hypothetical protein
MAEMEGDIVSKKQFIEACVELGDDEVEYNQREMDFLKRNAAIYWRKMPKLSPENVDGGRILVDGKQVPMRVLRRVEKWQKQFIHDSKSKTNRNCFDEFNKNVECYFR